MPKEKRSSSFRASQAKRRKQLQRQDPVKRQQQVDRQRERRQLASSTSCQQRLIDKLEESATIVSRERSELMGEDATDMGHEQCEGYAERRRQRDTEAHRLARIHPYRRSQEQQRNTASRRLARQDTARRSDEQKRDTAARRQARADPVVREHEQQRNTAARRQARADPVVREQEQQRDTAARRQARADPVARKLERNTAARRQASKTGGTTAKHSCSSHARADPQYRTQEQQISNIHRQQVSASRVPSLMALNYQPQNFCNTIDIGTLSIQCSHCGALKFPGEAESFCCSKGNVQLQPFPQPQLFLQHLYEGMDSNSKHFLNNIRKYNSAFQMTSFGCNEISMPGFNPSFRIQGQVYHRIGSMVPSTGDTPKFCQIYFIDNQESQVATRCQIVAGLRPDIVSSINQLLHNDNHYVQIFKVAKELFDQQDVPTNIRVVINEAKRPTGEHPRRYNSPLCDEVGVLMPNENVNNRDIVLHYKDGGLHYISELHRAYDPLQYPLIFPHGTDGWHINLKLANNKKLTALVYYRYHIMVRQNVSVLLRAKRLFQQFLVDAYCKIETERLQFLRREQKALRADCYQDLRDAIVDGDGDPSNVGRRIILPSTFTGGPRYMHERQQDAMTYVRKYGHPDLFITMTCNPNWPEIKNNLLPGQKPEDRPELVARVFRLKLKQTIEMLKSEMIFGRPCARLYSVEFQKRGLPHAHILVWLVPEHKITPDKIDNIICAEIPDPALDPELHQIVVSNMVHGPCGSINPTSPCMENGQCSKKYPKPFILETQQGADSYPLYRRRSPEDGGQVAVININVRGSRTTQEVDNRWVVPYNKYLLRALNCHCNVELCMSISSIKYVLKYVHKGCDQATFALRSDQVDEISEYQNARYIGSNEAAWRILEFPIHERFPPVQQLAVHLENGQRVYFTEDTARDLASREPPKTTLTEFFSLCQVDDFAKTLLYVNVPEYYTWNNKSWQRRKQGTQVAGYPGVKQAQALGRVYTISPRQGECFYLRLLLHNVKGPQSFAALRTVDGDLCSSFREACLKMGLLEDDNQYHLAMEEAIVSNSPASIRTLFAVILAWCEPSNPLEIYDNHKEAMAEDFLYEQRTLHRDQQLEMNDDIFNLALGDLQEKVISMGGRQLSEYGLPQPQLVDSDRFAREYRREINYDRGEQQAYVAHNAALLTIDQRDVYDSFCTMVDRNQGGLMFLDAPGGTGKTFLINLILARIRSEGKIALATASSGIAATLLTGGRTLHSTFKIPLDLNAMDIPVCSIKRGTALCKVIQEAKVIVVDEAPMTDKRAFEALDRTLRDLTGNSQPMGGICMLLCGDFRQILPVIPRGTRGNIVDACLKKSHLWDGIIVKHLHTNMRVYLCGDQAAGQFAGQLLAIGDGKFPTDNNVVQLPEIMGTFVCDINELMSRVYPDLLSNFTNITWLSERCILAPLNKTTRTINTTLVEQLPGECIQYKSLDSVPDESQAVEFPTEFLNSLEVSGLPPHSLSLKVGAPIIILRSLDPPRVTNGTRCVITKLSANTIDAKISHGRHAGHNIIIPRIPLIPSNSTLPFEFRRVQFPVSLCFAMTINKSQGQTFKAVGVDLTDESFTHGMLYVALSRVGSPDCLTMLVREDRKTRNVVYNEVFV